MDLSLPNEILPRFAERFCPYLFYSCNCTAFLISFTDDFLALIRESSIHFGVTS